MLVCSVIQRRIKLIWATFSTLGTGWLHIPEVAFLLLTPSLILGIPKNFYFDVAEIY